MHYHVDELVALAIIGYTDHRSRDIIPGHTCNIIVNRRRQSQTKFVSCCTNPLQQ